MSSGGVSKSDVFLDLFVLELANNHWGSVERGKEIIRQHGRVMQEEGVKTAIKFQFRDVDSFIDDSFKVEDTVGKKGEVIPAPGTSSRYIKKTVATKLTPAEFAELLEEVRRYRLGTMATPFDERSAEWCRDMDIDVVKIASQDAKSWTLIERIVDVGKPTIISNGGTDIEDLDRVVALFEERDVPLAINHCISLYPSEDHELELNQIDFLREHYPEHVIGLSTHEYKDWTSSVMIAYAKGARTFERHIDIEDEKGTPVSSYCSLPAQVQEWVRAYKKAKEMMGGSAEKQRTIPERERKYVESVSRGVYALRDLPKGHIIRRDGLGSDFKLAIPLQENQMSARDFGEEVALTTAVKKGQPVLLGV